MSSMTVELRNVEGTEVAMGWAGGHTMVVDRPEGKAGGKGLGFNGGQLLALAIGGCMCNDLRYVAHELGVALGGISVSVTLDLQGQPSIVTGATMEISCETLDGSDRQLVIDRAIADSTASNSVRRGFPISARAGG